MGNPSGKFKVHTKLDLNVAILKLFPGITQAFVESVLSIKNLRAVVLETFGAGNATSEEWFEKSLNKAIKKGVVILNVTQCNAGKVEQGRYQTSSQLVRAGVIGGADLTTEAALAKLMFLIGNESVTSKICSKLALSLRGELSPV